MLFWAYPDITYDGSNFPYYEFLHYRPASHMVYVMEIYVNTHMKYC